MEAAQSIKQILKVKLKGYFLIKLCTSGLLSHQEQIQALIYELYYN